MSVQKTMHHEQYQSRCKRMSNAELEYSIRDAQGALEAQPDGVNAGYYADEVCYLGMELIRRERAQR